MIEGGAILMNRYIDKGKPTSSVYEGGGRPPESEQTGDR